MENLGMRHLAGGEGVRGVGGGGGGGNEREEGGEVTQFALS